jgi:hypothetical protein
MGVVGVGKTRGAEDARAAAKPLRVGEKVGSLGVVIANVK